MRYSKLLGLFTGPLIPAMAIFLWPKEYRILMGEQELFSSHTPVATDLKIIARPR
ncbi:hypothetical protein LZ32DRAFT_610645 [Colletotrichum eremochloae]|nr:hypothetical protein LZ32DRAFT_610645 [Colletotrichum eremochloae]